MSTSSESIALHEKLKGKIEIKSKIPVTQENLKLLYTPGVAAVSLAVAKDKSKVYDYTSKWNLAAIVSDGSRVLGLGKIGPEAALPVMEGKAILFKQLGGVDAFPLCIRAQTAEEIIDFVKKISPTFGAVNIEDIETPKCFEVFERLNAELDIPVFHDDRQGTAVVALAGLINALRVVGKKKENAKVVIAGAGAAGFGIMEILLEYGFKNLVLVDSAGIIYKGRKENMNKYKEIIADRTNEKEIFGSLSDALAGADVLVAATGVVGEITKEMISSMGKRAIVFALTNPEPEISLSDAKSAGAEIVGTGRSDFPNQINNSVAFPGIFRGALDARARKINMRMHIAAAQAIADFVKNPSAENIIPATTDWKISAVVAAAVAKAARESGVV
ncbi:MAG TPA: NADP-dependent malic enzyme [archaeon]|nr:NADP-dependent malic enzyme [archaeon]